MIGSTTNQMCYLNATIFLFSSLPSVLVRFSIKLFVNVPFLFFFLFLMNQVASAFKAKFKKIAKRDYGNVKMTLSEKDLGEFPVMDFVFSNGSGGEVSCAL